MRKLGFSTRVRFLMLLGLVALSACVPIGLTPQPAPSTIVAAGQPSPSATATPTVTRVAVPTPTAPTPQPPEVPLLDAAPALAYDQARQEVVLLRIAVAGPETWLWRDGTWALAHPPQSPPERHSASMVYDEATGSVLLYGGVGDEGPLGDTWLWDGQTWQEQHPPSEPPVRVGARLVYDTARHVALLFGGEIPLTAMRGTPVDETWAWDGKTWTQLHPPVSPPPQSRATMAYDAARQEVVLYDERGGTWIWDGSSWQKREPARQPPLRGNAALGHDAVRRQIVLFGGGRLRDTWIWDGAEWTQAGDLPLADDFPSGRLLYDSKHQRLLLFVLSGDKIAGTRETVWAWNGQGWDRAY